MKVTPTDCTYQNEAGYFFNRYLGVIKFVVFALYLLLPVLRYLLEFIAYVQHQVAREGVAHGFRPSLSVDHNLGVR